MQRGDDAAERTCVRHRIGDQTEWVDVEAQAPGCDEHRITHLTQASNRAREQRGAAHVERCFVDTHTDAASTAEHHAAERRRWRCYGFAHITSSLVVRSDVTARNDT